MPEKDPSTWSWMSALVGVLASLGGGAIDYREQLKYRGSFKMGSFILDMVTSAFVGFLAWWVCREVLVQPEPLCACAAGFAGNLGARVFGIGKDIGDELLFRRFGVRRKDGDAKRGEG